MSIEKRELEQIWNKVWQSSNYAKHELRIVRAKIKIETLLDNGLVFKRNMKVLDAGCGDGSVLFLLTKGFGIKPYGIDVSPQAIKRAEKLFKDNGIESKFECADTRSLPFPSNYFDVVLSWGVIEHFNDYGLAIDELNRVLKQNGILNLIQPHLFSFGPLQRKWLEFTNKWESGSQIEFSGEFLRKLLTQKGFTEIKTFAKPPFSDLKAIHFMDTIVNRLWSKWGHYLYLIAKKHLGKKVEKTVILIKSDAFEKNLVNLIIQKIKSLGGINILEKKEIHPTRREVEDHHDKVLFESLGENTLREKLIEYWLSGPMMKILIEGPDAINRINDLVGSTDPRRSPEGTIRSLSQDSIETANKENRAVRNLAHSPRSKEEALRDLLIWFS